MRHRVPPGSERALQHAVAQIFLTVIGALYEHIHILHKVKGKIYP